MEGQRRLPDLKLQYLLFYFYRHFFDYMEKNCFTYSVNFPFAADCSESNNWSVFGRANCRFCSSLYDGDVILQVKKQFFEIEKDGFYGTYYENPKGSDCVVIGLFGDDPNDFMAKCGAKWLHKNGVNALCISPGKKNYSHVNNPLERIETAIRWLKNNGNRKIGIMGMSTAGMDSLVAASLYAVCV